MKPQIESKVAITSPIHETDIGTEKGPIRTVHCFDILAKWPIATTAKIRAENAA
jgi:hypothetical protein